MLKRQWTIFPIAVLTAACAPPAHGDTPPAAPPFIISPATTFITGPLRANGCVDYIAALNEENRAPAADNAFAGIAPVLRGPEGAPRVIWEKMLSLAVTKDANDLLAAPSTLPAQVRLNRRFRSYEEYLSETAALRGAVLTVEARELALCAAAPWEKAKHPQVAAYLTSIKGALDVTDNATQRPQWWLPLVAADPAHPVLSDVTPLGLPEVNDLAQALLARAMLRAGDGQFAPAVSDLAAVERLSRRLQTGLLAEHIAGITLENEAMHAAQIWLKAVGPTSDAGRAVRHIAAAAGPLPPLVDGVSLSLRFKCLDGWQYIAMQPLPAATQPTAAPPTTRPGDTSAPTSAPATALAGLAGIDRNVIIWNDVLRETNAIFNEYAAALQLEKTPAMRQAAATLEGRLLRVHLAAVAAAHQDALLGQRFWETPETYSKRVADIVIGTTVLGLSDLELQRRNAETLRTEIAAPATTQPGR